MVFATPINSSKEGLSPKPESWLFTLKPRERKKLIPLEPIKPSSVVAFCDFQSLIWLSVVLNKFTFKPPHIPRSVEITKTPIFFTSRSTKNGCL